MKNALHVQRYGKRYLSGWSDIKQWKIKSVALAIVELHLSEGINQSGSYSVAFRVNLTACLGLTNTAPSPSGGWFFGGLTSWATPARLMSLLWTTIVV